MPAQSEYFDGDDHQHLVNAAEALVAALASARHRRELLHLRGDIFRLQHDIERLRRALDKMPRIRPWYVLNVSFWSVH